MIWDLHTHIISQKSRAYHQEDEYDHPQQTSALLVGVYAYCSTNPAWP